MCHNIISRSGLHLLYNTLLKKLSPCNTTNIGYIPFHNCRITSNLAYLTCRCNLNELLGGWWMDDGKSKLMTNKHSLIIREFSRVASKFENAVSYINEVWYYH